MFEFKNIALGDLTVTACIVICTILAVLIIGSVVACFILRAKGHGTIITTKDITYGAVCLAASYALSFIGIKLPQGGTITPASSLPIMIFCYYFGFRKSAVLCTAYMLLQFLQDPYIVHPMSAVLDYAIPYLSLIFIGVFSYKQERYNQVAAAQKPVLAAHWTFFVGAGLYLIVRYMSHFLSGLIFYADFATGPVVGYSLAYNVFSLIDGAVAVACAAGLLCSKAFNRFMAANRNTFKNADAAAKDNQGT